MKTLLFLALLASFIGAPIYLLYWKVFRVVLLERLKYRLFEARDDLRLKLITGEIGQKEKGYECVERCCNKAIARIDGIDLFALLKTSNDKQTSLEAQRDLETILNAPLEIRRIFFTIIATVIGAAFANSPGILIVFVPAAVIISLSALWFNRAKTYCRNLRNRVIQALFYQDGMGVSSKVC
jgi:hypothetical protein